MLKEIYERLGQSFPLERLLLYCILALATTCFIHFGIFSFLNSPWDFDHLAGYYEIAWRFWTTQTFPPGYNPYLQGGRTLGGDPQIFLYSPWLVWASFSPLSAVKIQMLTELAVSAWGLWKLLSRLNLSHMQCLWGLFLFLTSGGVVSRMATGHVTLGYLFFYPLLLWLSLQFEQRAFWKTRPFALSLVLFAYLGNHKPNFFIYGLPPLFVEAVIRCILQKNFRPFLALSTGSMVGVLINAASLLPSFFYFRDFPRHDGDEWVAVPLHTFFLNLLMPLRTLPGNLYGKRFLQRHEYCVFLGPLALYFAVRGFRFFRHNFRSLFTSLLLTSVLFVWVGLGSDDNAFGNPYRFFYRFWPGFHSVRVPPRFWIFASFTLLVFSAFGIIPPKTKKGYTFLLIVGILPLLLSAIVNLSKPTLEALEPFFLPPRKSSSPLSWTENDVRFQLVPLRAGLGVLNSIDNLAFPRNRTIRPDNLLSFFASHDVKASFVWKSWSEIVYEVESTEISTIALNLNAHPYWQLVGQGTIKQSEPNGSLTIQVGNGISRGMLSFKQPMVLEGLIISLLSLGVLLLYVTWIFFAGKKPKTKLHRIIGLTGGIGSGKSTVASLFREEGIPVIDMDQIGRELIETNPAIQESLMELFGKSIKTKEGIDRKKIREIIFEDTEKRKKLEALLHPPIWKKFYELAKKEFDLGKSVVLCEAALLIENKRLDQLDGLIVVIADENTRKERLLARDKVSHSLAEKILKTQVTDAERRQKATYLIENEAGFYDLKEKVKILVRKL